MHASMEATFRLPVLLICLSLLLHDVHSFVVDRRGKEADELTEALKIIQRAKRRLADDDVGTDKGYYWMDRLGLTEDEEETGADDTRALRDIFEEGPEEGILEEEGPEAEEEEVGRNELENLFRDESEKEMSVDEVEDLLDAERPETPVENEEIQEVLEVSEPNEDGSNTVKMHEDKWLITPEKTLHSSHEDQKEVAPEDQNMEQMEEVGRPVEINTKKKRSEDQVLAQGQPGEYDGDVDLSYIKKFVELEDEENTNLANALNLATRSQVERTDKYIPLEVQYLKESIKDEETIQAIKDQLGIGNSDEDDDEEDVVQEDEVDLVEDDVPVIEDDEDEESEIHRILSQHLKQFLLKTEMDRNDDDDMETNEVGQWLNNPVKANDDAEDQEKLNPFLRELLSKLSSRRPSISKRDMWRHRRGEMFEKIALEEEKEAEEEEEEENVRNEIASLMEALEEKSEEDEAATQGVEEGECLSIEEYTDNCAYVRDLGMGLDAEALDLCNRHQLCYNCGAYYGMNADTCDRGFLSEADRLCRGDETCKDEAAGLYFFMLRDRFFVAGESTGFACAAKCTYDFIAGGSDV